MNITNILESLSPEEREQLWRDFFRNARHDETLPECLESWLEEIKIKREFIKEVEKAEKRVKEGKAKTYTIEEFKEKFKPQTTS